MKMGKALCGTHRMYPFHLAITSACWRAVHGKRLLLSAESDVLTTGPDGTLVDGKTKN